MRSLINKWNYLDEADVLVIHHKIIENTGGSHGIRDLGLIKGALARPQSASFGKELFPTVFEKAASYLESIARNHPFVDGNKRTAFALAVRFTETNGFIFDATNKEVEDFVVRVITDHINTEGIALWLKNHTKKSK